MKNLIYYKEFENGDNETSNYRIPYAAVEPPPDDKIWNYIKKSMNKMPIWGHKFKKQEDENAIKGDRAKND